MKTSKSPKAIAQLAYITAKQSLPAHRHIKSPKKFTQHQLVACLVLKEFFKTDYRGIEEILKDNGVRYPYPFKFKNKANSIALFLFLSFLFEYFFHYFAITK